MEYLDALKSIDTLYYVSDKPLDLNNFDANPKHEGDFGSGIYLFASKEAATANFKYLRHNQLQDDWQQERTYQIYEYSLNILAINTDALTNLAWGYNGQEQNGRMVATDLTSEIWFSALQKQYPEKMDIIAAPICYYQLKYAPSDTTLPYMGYKMNPKILSVCFNSQFGLNMLSYRGEGIAQNAISLLIDADEQEKKLYAPLQKSFGLFIHRWFKI